MSGLLKLLRPTQWVKNGFVLAPLIFAGLFTDADAVINVLLATALFCVASSIVYIINDYRDIDSDRQHPVKSRTRPLASGEVGRAQALVLLAVLCAALVLGFLQLPPVTLAITAYIVMNIGYTYFLKDQPVIEMFVIAVG
ncbi:MAG: UbiA family prenyltransferase, partial [Halioglobus sp.]|nr:UbiA family prenyltransferase [Halioglobus sp.]